MDPDDGVVTALQCICRPVTYILWPSKFASCLEDVLLQESST